MDKLKIIMQCFGQPVVLFWIIAAMSLTSCGEEKPVIPMPEEPILVSSIPANGDSNIIVNGSLTVTLTYDQNVFCPSAGHSSITVTSGGTVGSVAASGHNVTLVLSGLHKSTTYTLTIPAGVVVGPAKVPAPQVAITFRTVDSQDIRTSELVTSNPSPEAVNLFNYFKQQYGNHIISGAMARVAWNTDEAEMVYALTGKYPAMNTFDYIHLWASPANWIDYGNISAAANWWNSGGIVSACWHWNVPKSSGAAAGDVTFRPEETTFRPANAVVEGTWENTVVKADFAKIAGYLKLLSDAHIPVIWRPMHEAAGNIFEYPNGTAWFWWGRDGGAAYVALWRYMFDYFQQQGLNNLIWVWTTQTKDASFYPGDNYVDIVGRDIYNMISAASSFEQFSTIINAYPNKLAALSECGTIASISQQWDAGAKWLFFMPWYDYDATSLIGHEHADGGWWIDAVANPAVITRDEVVDLAH
ncbi:MAG: Ig-like domain-containing protein [Bacteroidales bacterium]|jgi:mannan endo-1,4-beta-mannosidase|nr:Ig-like domain-containing protein [Bacteroidales bacterium]